MTEKPARKNVNTPGASAAGKEATSKLKSSKQETARKVEPAKKKPEPTKKLEITKTTTAFKKPGTAPKSAAAKPDIAKAKSLLKSGKTETRSATDKILGGKKPTVSVATSKLGITRSASKADQSTRQTKKPVTPPASISTEAVILQPSFEPEKVVTEDQENGEETEEALIEDIAEKLNVTTLNTEEDDSVLTLDEEEQ